MSTTMTKSRRKVKKTNPQPQPQIEPAPQQSRSTTAEPHHHRKRKRRRVVVVVGSRMRVNDDPLMVDAHPNDTDTENDNDHDTNAITANNVNDDNTAINADINSNHVNTDTLVLLVADAAPISLPLSLSDSVAAPVMISDDHNNADEPSPVITIDESPVITVDESPVITVDESPVITVDESPVITATTTITNIITTDLIVDAHADSIEPVVALSPVVASTNNDIYIDLFTKEHFKCIPDHLLTTLRERGVPDRAALLDAAIRCAPCTASLLVLVDWQARIYHDNTPTLAAPASAYATALAWRERCDSLTLLASLTHSLAVDQRDIVMRGGSSARAALAHLRERFTNETFVVATAMSTISTNASSSTVAPPPPTTPPTTTTTTANRTYRCGSIEKTLDFEAMRDLRDGRSIRASLVDCYFEYCIAEKYPRARNRVFCMAAAYAQQLVGARMYDGGEDILFVIESVRTQMAMRESQSGTPIELLLMPVALPGHVTLLGVHLLPNATTLVYIDSMNGAPPRGLFSHMTTLLGERAVNVQSRQANVPFQYGSDCGLHTMFYGEQFISRISRDKDLSAFDLAESDRMDNFRREIYRILSERCS